jgi:lysophospholipase L1-like esterase
MSSEQSTHPTKQKTPLSRRRKLQFSIFIMSFVLLALGALELLSRFHYTGRFPSGMIAHSVRDHTHRANWRGFEGAPKRGIQVEYNNLGLRESRTLAKTAPSGKRLLLVGDSIVFGYRLHQSQTMSVLMENSLGEQGKLWQVVNVGCYGYAVQDEAHWLEDLQAHLTADLVILVVCYNDFVALETKARKMPSAFSEFLDSHSALAFTVSRKWHQVQRWLATRGTRELTRIEIDQLYLVEQGGEQRAAQTVFEHTVKLEKTAKKMGARLAVVVWPGKLHFREYLESGKIPGEQKQFAKSLRKTFPGIKVLIPYSELKGYGLAETELYMDHCHPSAKGVGLFVPRLVKLVDQAL